MPTSTPQALRTGLLAKKLGMTRIFKDDGTHVPVTVLHLDQVQVVATRTEEKDGYTAVQIGYGKAKVKNVTQPQRGHFAKAKVEPKQKLVEFRVASDALLEPGATLSAAHFAVGQIVDVCARPRARASPAHEALEFRRARSLARCVRAAIARWVRPVIARTLARPSRTRRWKAISAPTDHHPEFAGGRRRRRKGLIMIKGAVPGGKNGYVLVRDAIKRPRPADAAYPAALIEASPTAPASTTAPV